MKRARHSTSRNCEESLIFRAARPRGYALIRIAPENSNGGYGVKPICFGVQSRAPCIPHWVNGCVHDQCNDSNTSRTCIGNATTAACMYVYHKTSIRWVSRQATQGSTDSNLVYVASTRSMQLLILCRFALLLSTRTTGKSSQ